MKKKLSEKLVKPNFPFVEIAALSFFLFILIVCINKYWIDEKQEYGWLILIVAALLIAFSWLFSRMNKTIKFSEDKIQIRYWLIWHWKTISNDEIKGYELKETYTRYGLDYHIHILTETKNYVLIKDKYPDYERLKKLLQLQGIRYLGTTEIQSKHKQLFSTITIWGSTIAVLMFALFQLMKMIG